MQLAVQLQVPRPALHPVLLDLCESQKQPILLTDWIFTAYFPTFTKINAGISTAGCRRYRRQALITEGGGGDPINPLDVLWRREGTLTANTDSQTQKRTLHAVLCAKPLLPEGTAALVFG